MGRKYVGLALAVNLSRYMQLKSYDSLDINISES